MHHIPKEVRDLLGLAPGERVRFLIQDDSTVLVCRDLYPTVESLRGSAVSHDPSIMLEKMIGNSREERLLKKFGYRVSE